MWTIAVFLPRDPVAAKKAADRAVYIAASWSGVSAVGAIVVATLAAFGLVPPAAIPYLIGSWLLLCVADVMVQHLPVLFRAGAPAGMAAMDTDRWTSYVAVAGMAVGSLIVLFGPVSLGFWGFAFIVAAIVVSAAEMTDLAMLV